MPDAVQDCFLCHLFLLIHLLFLFTGWCTRSTQLFWVTLYRPKTSLTNLITFKSHLLCHSVFLVQHSYNLIISSNSIFLSIEPPADLTFLHVIRNQPTTIPSCVLSMFCEFKELCFGLDFKKKKKYLTPSQKSQLLIKSRYTKERQDSYSLICWNMTNLRVEREESSPKRHFSVIPGLQ